MKKVHIVTDSTADLKEEDILKYGLHVVPLTIQIDGETFIDGVDIQPEEFLEYDEKFCETAEKLAASGRCFQGVV